MRITTKKIIDSETGRPIYWESYEYSGCIDRACSDSGTVENADNAMLATDAATNKATAADAQVTFANQQQILGQLTAKMQYLSSNPTGLSPQELAVAKSSINNNTSVAASQAIGKAAAFAAAHSSGDVAGGGMGAEVGSIASAATNAKTQSLSQLSLSDEAVKRANQWQALSGLNQAGADYGGATGTELSGSTSSSTAGTDAGKGALSAANVSFNDVTGMMGAIGGDVTAAAGLCVTGETSITMADQSEQHASDVNLSDEFCGLDGKEVVERIEKSKVPCVTLLMDDGNTITISNSHTFATPSGGYVEAAFSEGRILRTQDGQSRVKKVTNVGEKDVFKFKLSGSHGYVTNGLWSLE